MNGRRFAPGFPWRGRGLVTGESIVISVTRLVADSEHGVDIPRRVRGVKALAVARRDEFTKRLRLSRIGGVNVRWVRCGALETEGLLFKAVQG